MTRKVSLGSYRLRSWFSQDAKGFQACVARLQIPLTPPGSLQAHAGPSYHKPPVFRVSPECRARNSPEIHGQKPLYHSASGECLRTSTEAKKPKRQRGCPTSANRRRRNLSSQSTQWPTKTVVGLAFWIVSQKRRPVSGATATVQPICGTVFGRLGVCSWLVAYQPEHIALARRSFKSRKH